ncbi:YCF48-related protein [Pseudomonas sp. 10B1]|uniref:WD40/YVTN/BNR-like repeat-containing protein n=1 Tax=unclassified Pseudomonas TaxID=196821 RepID=UPI002AB42F46|nr:MULTISPECIES: YCF48-related protein [unclassified Pseudomonas]MDY7559406.1 YCF48-related protein [Pseudomonas sp. AB6]MEA9996626.1 YCF48-related protein [Pseudomonas sp. AA4]MEB0087925.1 YCF48-related protein [Pseudomonas sp. RTI1]MEB0128132.1 YCF48-related protein [Pseudomonas sp. CCC1.2]MEB0155529.1 YCF48-related protein [Pseudomonas sp. CCC4.3]
MSEPVSRRTQLDGALALCPPLTLHKGTSLAAALCVLGVLSVFVFCTPVYAAQAAAQNPEISILSSRSSRSLLLGITHAGARLVTVGDRGHILYSDDQGKTWTQATVPSRQLLTAVYFADDKHGWAVGHDAQILASIDGGVTWTKQFEDLKREAPLLDLWFKDINTGFAVGAYGALLTTTDGGAHWADVSDRIDNQDQYHYNGITYVKDSGLFIVGEQGCMFRSADDGQTWERVQSPYQGSLFGVIATAKPATLLAYGLRGNLLRSTNFGDTWTPIGLKGARGPLEFGLSGASLLPDDSLVLVGNGGSVMRSSDNGQTFVVTNRSDRISLAGVTVNDKGDLILVGQGGVHITSPTGAELVQQ